MEPTNTDRIKVCSQCGASFTCSTVNCWCSTLPAVMPMSTDGDCYCPKCLTNIIEQKTAGKKQG